MKKNSWFVGKWIIKRRKFFFWTKFSVGLKFWDEIFESNFGPVEDLDFLKIFRTFWRFLMFKIFEPVEDSDSIDHKVDRRIADWKSSPTSAGHDRRPNEIQRKIFCKSDKRPDFAKKSFADVRLPEFRRPEHRWPLRFQKHLYKIAETLEINPLLFPHGPKSGDD